MSRQQFSPQHLYPWGQVLGGKERLLAPPWEAEGPQPPPNPPIHSGPEPQPRWGGLEVGPPRFNGRT